MKDTESEEKMSSISADYERFLIANFPDEYRRITVKDVKEDVVQAIKSRLDDEYAIWCQIPEWIKNEYRDDLPDEVLHGNKSVRDFIDEEEKANANIVNTENDNKLTDFGVSLIALGYAAETVAMLAESRSKREALLKNAGDDGLSDEEFEEWLATRDKDCKVISKDWKENQKEKYFMHVVKEMSRTKKRKQRADSPSETIAYEMKETSLERYFRKFAKELENEEFRRKVIDYLRLAPQQAALRHLDKDVLDKFIDVLGSHGVKVNLTNPSPIPVKLNSLRLENK